MNIDRVNSELQKELQHILSYELKDPRLDDAGMISVMRAEATRDLKYCKVYLSLMDAKDPKGSIKSIQQTAGYIRKLLFGRLKIRAVPQLIFELDESINYGIHIDKILRGLNISHEDTSDADDEE